VQQHWPEDTALGAWVSNQRASKKRGALSPERVHRLEELGFVWDRLEASWEESFAKLQNYQKREGHCKVPVDWSEDPKLGSWVFVQRRAKRRGKLGEERTRRLESIDFEW
jgi:helicase associated protein